MYVVIIKLKAKNIICAFPRIYYDILIFKRVKYVKYYDLKMLITSLKIIILYKTLVEVQIMFMPLSLIIGPFSLFLKGCCIKLELLNTNLL